MTYTVNNPFMQFTNPVTGRPVGIGKLYIGEIDQDPQDAPVTVYAVQPDGSEIEISQPITLLTGGVPSLDGFPVQLKTDAGTYSVKVTGANDDLIYYTARAYGPDYQLRKDLEDGTAIIAGITSANFRNFLIVTPPTGDSGLFFNNLITSGIRNIFCSAGEYVFNTSMVVNDVRLNLLGAGKTISLFKRGPSLGTANIITGELHDLQVSQIGFDTGKGTYTPTLADFTQENAINSLSPLSLKITACDFKNTVNLGVVVNGTAMDEAKDIDISGNTASIGTRGFAMVRRYGNNVHMDRNVLYNTVDVANTLFKPLEISGTNDGWMCDNIITQDNGAGGQIIFEYIDRECINVHMERNTYYGGGDGAFKVGPSTNVWFNDNHSSGGVGICAYFEGVENLWMNDNRLRDANRNNVVIAQDLQTLRFCKNVKIMNNHFLNANIDNATPGTPYGGVGSNGSYHLWIQDGTEDVELAGNHYIKGTNVAGGVLISSPSYTIKGENFSKLDAAAVTVHNGFAPVGAKYEIIDCIGCQTTDSGQLTIAAGSPSGLIEPNIVTHLNPHTLTTLRTALSGTVAYTYAEADAAPDVAVLCRDSAHMPASPSSDINVDWSVDCSKVAKGALGKTAV